MNSLVVHRRVSRPQPIPGEGASVGLEQRSSTYLERVRALRSGTAPALRADFPITMSDYVIRLRYPITMSGAKQNLSMKKTNAARLLDRHRIDYCLLAYAVDPDNLDATHTARNVGLPAEQLFKTLVARGDRNGACFAVIPASAQLDLKALAHLSGDRKQATVPLKEVEPLTGYIRGGVTAIAAKKPFPTFVDASVRNWKEIAVSAGARGLLLYLASADYLVLTAATVGAIA